MHEAQMHLVNSFITLTYDDEHDTAGLDYRDFRLFMRRLRKAKGKCRFFAAGEYGTQTNRPHWHALIFGQGFANQTPIGANIYRSPELEQLWTNGYSSIGEVNYQTASYVASYCIKKALANTRHLVNLPTGEILRPEFARMSLKPGIGYTWFQKYWSEVYLARDGVVQQGGHTTPAPRYYDKLLHIQQPTLAAEKETQRQLNAITRQQDNTPERLKAKELNATLIHKAKTRKL